MVNAAPARQNCLGSGSATQSAADWQRYQSQTHHPAFETLMRQISGSTGAAVADPESWPQHLDGQHLALHLHPHTDRNWAELFYRAGMPAVIPQVGAGFTGAKAPRPNMTVSLRGCGDFKIHVASRCRKAGKPDNQARQQVARCDIGPSPVAARSRRMKPRNCRRHGQSLLCNNAAKSVAHACSSGCAGIQSRNRAFTSGLGTMQVAVRPKRR